MTSLLYKNADKAILLHHQPSMDAARCDAPHVFVSVRRLPPCTGAKVLNKSYKTSDNNTVLNKENDGYQWNIVFAKQAANKHDVQTKKINKKPAAHGQWRSASF